MEQQVDVHAVDQVVDVDGVEQEIGFYARDVDIEVDPDD